MKGLIVRVNMLYYIKGGTRLICRLKVLLIIKDLIVFSYDIVNPHQVKELIQGK